MRQQQHGGNAYYKRSRVRYRPSRTAARLGSRVVEPTAKFLGVDGNRARKIRCGCRWKGTVGQLVNPASGPTMFGVGVGAGFPVCPRCMRDDRLN